MQQNVIALGDFRVDSVLAVDGSCDEVQVVLAVVAFAGREEAAVQVVTVVIDGAAAAVSPCKLNASGCELTHIRLVERILMTANHHARVVQPQHENVMIAEVIVLVDPILESEVGEDVIGLTNEDRLADRLALLCCRSR